MSKSKLLAWIDLEMTGLDANEHTILEIASLVTDSDLNIVATGPELIIHQPQSELDKMDELVAGLHNQSGLTPKVLTSEISMASAEQQTIDFFAQFADSFTMPLCGNSIWQDKFFLHNHMPALNAFFHYRIVDVSSIKELVTRWYGAPEFKKAKVHRALSDIQESVAELRFYKEKYFVGQGDDK